MCCVVPTSTICNGITAFMRTKINIHFTVARIYQLFQCPPHFLLNHSTFSQTTQNSSNSHRKSKASFQTVNKNIRSNENADTAARTGLDVAIFNMRFPVSDLLTCVNQLCVKEWQQLWSQCTSNKLYCVQPVIGRNRNPSLSRYDSVLVNRLQIGHTRLTNSYLLKGENQSECQVCHSPLTVKHFLIDCTCFGAAR